MTEQLLLLQITLLELLILQFPKLQVIPQDIAGHGGMTNANSRGRNNKTHGESLEGILQQQITLLINRLGQMQEESAESHKENLGSVTSQT